MPVSSADAPLLQWLMLRSSATWLQVYATSMAMVVTMVVSIALFSLVPSLQLMLGITTASISLVLYYVSPSMLLAIPETDLGAKNNGHTLPK